jgi:flagellar biosynthesis protein FlhA
VIGLIVFAILVIVNFVNQSSARIAEVSARFSLDAMPGKQMAIDADLSAGLVDEKARRRQLEEESSLYGAMDGAAKFVRGDAIAGLPITLQQPIGGLIIGAGQMGVSFAEAERTDSLLTVGDGLVSQIPGLIVSTAAALLVARAGVAPRTDRALFGQLGADPGRSAARAACSRCRRSCPGCPFCSSSRLPVRATRSPGTSRGASATRRRPRPRLPQPRRSSTSRSARPRHGSAPASRRATSSFVARRVPGAAFRSALPAERSLRSQLRRELREVYLAARDVAGLIGEVRFRAGRLLALPEPAGARGPGSAIIV